MISFKSNKCVDIVDNSIMQVMPCNNRNAVVAQHPRHLQHGSLVIHHTGTITAAHIPIDRRDKSSRTRKPLIPGRGIICPVAVNIRMTRYMGPDFSGTSSHTAAHHCGLVIRKHRNVTDFPALALDAHNVIIAVPILQLIPTNLLQLPGRW